MFPHATGGLLKSHCTQYLSASRLTPYEMSLLTCDITLSCYNNLNLATLLPLHGGKTTHDCLILTGQLLTLSSDLQEILFTDGSRFKNGKENGAGCAVICSF